MVMVYGGMLWTVLRTLRLGTNDNSHEDCNERMDSIHGGEFIEQLSSSGVLTGGGVLLFVTELVIFETFLQV